MRRAGNYFSCPEKQASFREKMQCLRRLTDEEVALIRRTSFVGKGGGQKGPVPGEYTQYEMAQQLGVSTTTIHNVRTRKTYRHLP